MTSQWFPRPLHIFAAALILCTILTTLSAQDETPAAGEAATDVPEDPAAGAPEVPPEILDGAAGWLNTDKPLSMKDLRGKVVLFDWQSMPRFPWYQPSSITPGVYGLARHFYLAQER